MGILTHAERMELPAGSFQALGALSSRSWLSAALCLCFQRCVRLVKGCLVPSNARWGWPSTGRSTRLPSAKAEQHQRLLQSAKSRHGNACEPSREPRVRCGRVLSQFCAENMSYFGAGAFLLYSAMCYSDDMHPWKALESHWEQKKHPPARHLLTHYVLCVTPL